MHWIKLCIFRVDSIMTAVEHAKKIGTYEAVDRSAQYTKVSNGELLKAVNDAWTKIRRCEKTLQEKDVAIEELNQKLRRYRIGYTALISIITGLAWEGLRALIPILLTLFR